MKLHTESAACHTRAHCAACQDPGAAGVMFRLSRRSAGYLDLPANGAVLPCPHGQKPPPIVTADSGGPGTELKRLLARRPFRFVAGSSCACNRHAVQMNVWGVTECSKEERVAEIVDWLEAEAQTRGLPFSRTAGRVLVWIAVRAAARAQIRHGGAGRG